MSESKYLPLLLLLLQKGANARPLKLSTTEMADWLSISQQSASRWLTDLERSGHITRSGSGISLTAKGVNFLRSLHASLSRAFKPTGTLILRGKVFTGLGEGRYYMSQQNYKKQFKSKLGFVPYAGTLNLRLADPAVRAPLDLSAGTRIDGFHSSNRFFGALNAHRAVINDKARGALIVPDRTHYGRDVIEVIAKENLKKVLKRKDGDLVRVSVEFE